MLQKPFKKSLAISLVLISSALAGCGGATSTALPSVLSQLSTTSGSNRVQGPALSSVARQALVTNTYPTAVLASNPLAYYQLNDSAAILVDAGSNGISGTYGSGVSLKAPAITQGSSSAAGFPGGTSYNANGFAYTAPTTSLQPTTISVEAWIKYNSSIAPNTYVPIAVYGGQGISYGLYLQGISNNQSTIFYQQTNVGQSGRLFLHGSTHLSVGAVYHVVIAFDGTNVRSYVNGLLDQTMSDPGAVGYFRNVTGLQIGGQTSSSDASFPGTIAHVAVYGSALSAATVVNHFLIGQLLPMTSEDATPADTLVDSIGINTHFENGSSAYVLRYPEVQSLLVASGIRHIRGNMATSPDFVSKMRQLAAYKIHGTFATSLTTTQAQVQGYPALVYPSLEQIEAPNELDDQGNPNWAQTCAAFQQTLYGWVKGSPATSSYPLLGPGLAFPRDYQLLPDLSSFMDVGSLHDYMAAYNPGFPGGPWGGMNAMVAYERLISGTKPIVATEEGYGTVTGAAPGNLATAVDDRTDLRYMTRLMFEQLKAGVSRSYSYEFINESTAGGFSTFGILNNDLSPKPAYTGIKSLIGTLQDPGPPFTASSLSYNLSGLSTVHHLLMQKRDGSFVLALWIELPSWNAVGGGDISVPTQSITLTTATNFSSATLSAMDESGNIAATVLPWTNQQTTVTVSDKVSLVTLKP
jgi:Concanavalin A-like lectin/glucanases superfamily